LSERRDLGISKSSLTRRMPDLREKDRLSGPHDDAQKELARLRRENELLRAARDLLKKAAATSPRRQAGDLSKHRCEEGRA